MRRWIAAPERGPLLRWGGWFFFINGLLMGVIGVRYLASFPWPDAWPARIYVAAAFVSHFVSLGVLGWLALVLPLTLLLPYRRLIVPLAVLTGSVALSLLLVDSLVFADNHYHINRLTMTILGWKTWGFAILYFAILTLFSAMLARWTWQRFGRPATTKVGRYVTAAIVVVLIGVHGVHAWADAAYYVPVTSFSPYLPLFRPATARSFFTERGLVDLEQARERKLVDRFASAKHDGALRYPLHPLRCEPPERPLNVLIVLVDAMRADAMNREVAPAISAFAEQSIVFANHYSGGNSSRIGAFSIFYGLPSTYWGNFEGAQRSPVLMDAFMEHGYQLGIFAGGPLYHPVDLDRTAFVHVPDLQLEPETESGSAWEGDLVITEQWLEWLDRRDPDRPFFGFLFFDGPPKFHPPDYRPVFEPPQGASKSQEAFAQYKTAIHFGDGLVRRVLDDVEARGLLEDTVVIVSSDHGEEFDETGLGYARHGSGYSRYQLHTPMVVSWPGREPRIVERRTSHNDIAPTLLSEVFSCANPPSDYSSGTSLFDGEAWSWLVVGSYNDFAIVEPDRVTISHTSGGFEIRDKDYRLAEELIVDREVLAAALAETTRFYAN